MQRFRPTLCFFYIVTLAIILQSNGYSDDWAGWMGSKRDGVYRETGIIDEIGPGGLKIKWRKPVQGGYAGPAVANGQVFLFDYKTDSGSAFNDPGKRAELKGQERLTVFDAKTGKQVWQHAYDCPYSISYPAGPRCTPTVSGQHVYILGAEGDLKCLSVANGEVVWQRSLKNDFGAEAPIWGFSAHPLVDGELLYCMVGGQGQTVVAFHKMTGEVKWKSGDAKAGYCPPQIIEAGGTRQLIVFHPEAVEGWNPTDGKVYWSVPMKPSYEMSVALPVRLNNMLYVSAIHTEAVMIELDANKPDAKEVWRGEAKNAVHCSNAAPQFVDGVVFGTDCLQGNMIAVDSKDGSRIWDTFAPTKPDEKRFIKHGTAFITRIGESDRYFLMSENGDLIHAKLTRGGYSEQGRFHVLDPTNEAFGRPVVWSHPAYAGRTAFMRNDKELVAVDLAKSP